MRQLSETGHAKAERSLSKMEAQYFDGERPDMDSEHFEAALRALVEYEVARLTQFLVLLVARLGWLQILFKKMAERAPELKSLRKAKERVQQDARTAFGKITSWIAAPVIQAMARVEPFAFISALSEVRKWRWTDVCEGSMPWLRGGDQRSAMTSASASKFAQRLRVALQVNIFQSHSKPLAD